MLTQYFKEYIKLKRASTFAGVSFQSGAHALAKPRSSRAPLHPAPKPLTPPRAERGSKGGGRGGVREKESVATRKRHEPHTPRPRKVSPSLVNYFDFTTLGGVLSFFPPQTYGGGYRKHDKPMRCPIDVSREIAERSQDSSRVILIAHGMGLAFLPDGGGTEAGPSRALTSHNCTP